MLVIIAFFLYFLILFLYIIYTGLNFYRIQYNLMKYPQSITCLLPFLVNYILANYAFRSLNPLLTTLMPCLVIYFLGQKLKKVRIFGLTGGIACGKSTLVNQMQQHLSAQFSIIDCDRINHELSYKDNKGYKLILNLLKKHNQPIEKYINEYSKQLKRQVLSNFAFNNKEFRKQLTKSMGKLILWQIVKQIFYSYTHHKKLVLIDAPILFQTKILAHICFPIIVVGCPQQQQIKRLVQFRKMTVQEAKNRIHSQMPLQQKKKRADVYIENTGSTQDLFTNTLKKLNRILQLTKNK